MEGLGYATIRDVLAGALSGPFLLLLLAALKLLATSLALGTGASGGVFTPALYVGSTLGACCALLLARLFPGPAFPVRVLALAGMAALVAGLPGRR